MYEAQRKWREAHPEKVKQIKKAWMAKNKEHVKQLLKDWFEKNRQRKYERTRELEKKYPERRRARNMLRMAIYEGEIKRLPCEVCGEEKSHAHHFLGYDYPFEVKWLCVSHHLEAHGGQWKS